MSKKTKQLLIFLLLVILVVFIIYLLQTHKQNNLIAPSVNATTTKAGQLTLYPNPSLTPGDILATDANTVCVKGYSKTVRNVPVEEKRQVYGEYNISYPEPQGSYEVDHFISLELGGSNDIKNLWPEPAEPVPGFHEKDKVENYLHDQVCNGNMTLQEAQKEISTDWYSVYLKIAH